MKERILHIFVCVMALVAVISCTRDIVEVDGPDGGPRLPEGVPVTIYIPFDGKEFYDVSVRTKAEASESDEARIHDLYVMIFDNNHLIGENNDSPKKIYGRYFSYEHLKTSLEALQADDNECWYVENVDLNKTVTETKGAVKVSTITCSNARLVVIANVENSVTHMDGIDELDRLKEVQHYKELQGIQVCLEQDVVNRKYLFLMKGELAVNTTEMFWGTLSPKVYNVDSRVILTPVDAKVKFRVKVNSTNISAVTPVYWQVHNTPDRCYLDSDHDGGAAPADISYFDSQQYYFEGTEEETVGDETYTWYTFCFYMLENREAPNNTAEEYYQRELRYKIDSGISGYKGPTGPESDGFSDHYVDNGDWRFAPTFGTYVRFDLVLTLTMAGIEDIGGEDPEGLTIGHALTSDAIFTVHLGDFSSSDSEVSAKLNNYNTLRGHSYTYDITINNTKSIYAEVKNDNEVQSGQEGFLLLTDAEIINADAHYEYHQITFDYRPDMSQQKFSWYVKTPFGEGGPKISYNESTGKYSYDADGLDYQWVKFGVNGRVPDGYVPAPGEANPDPIPYYSDVLGGTVYPYTSKRHAYPGDSHYHPEWEPGKTVNDGDGLGDKSVPDLMDITQLIEYIFSETAKEKNGLTSDFVADNDLAATIPVIRVTAFIDEYYYEEDPTRPGSGVDPELWRRFVNANPRELHILSDAQSSRDRKSDVILSSHSIIQQSIQTMYNIYAADLHSLWGTEHKDEMREKTNGWPYWPLLQDASSNPPGSGGRAGNFNTEIGKENGRLNSAYIWDFYSKQDEKGTELTDRTWETYLSYDVHNSLPELKEEYHGMAWSCLTRNRDNNGNGVVDRNEVRWYLAACNQLAGMWIGNNSLSLNARLYRPAEGEWRAHVISSSGKMVSWTEEGGGATAYSWDYEQEQCWGIPGDKATSIILASHGESVRCLRNIGTYSDDGVIKEISEAPYTMLPEKYFTFTDNLDGSYTFHFDRINPKSIREFSEGELPYHDQQSVSNSVYQKMTVQRPEDDVEAYSVKYETLNNEVTAKDYNPYCPPGYRFPNQRELLLMTLYLPQSYFDINPATGSSYGSYYMPTRTYYDKGIFGSKKNDPASNPTEKDKVGWAYNSGNHKSSCAKRTDVINHSRCVRDDDMTGTIEGGILMKDEIYPGDNVPLSFSFYSSGASFISASLKLCFTDGNGVYHERDIPVQKTPSGLEFLTDQTYTLPALSSMNLTEEILNNNGGALRNMKFKFTLRNTFNSQTFEQPFVLGNPIDGAITAWSNRYLVPGSTKNLDFNISSKANTCPLTEVSLKMKYTDGDDNKVERTLVIPALGTESLTYVHAKEAISIPSLGALGLDTSDLPRTATLELFVKDAGGSSKTFTLDRVYSRNIQLSLTETFDGFRIKAKEDGTSMTFKYADGSVQFSQDMGETWTTYDGRVFSLNAGDVVCFQGIRTSCDCIGTTQLFNANKVCYIAGDITSLLADPTKFADYAFRSAFSNGLCVEAVTNPAAVTWVDIDPDDPLILPAFTSRECYREMFRNCTSLTSVPDLPAETAAPGCYWNMFRLCTGLITANITLAATTMSEDCCREMFRQCTNLTSVPVFRASVLAARCYSQMLSNDTALLSVTCLATDISADKCTENWMSGVTNNNTRTFYKASTMNSWTLGNSGIPNKWNVENYSE